MEALPNKENQCVVNTDTFVSMTDEISSVMESLTASYSKTICEHMKRLGCTIEDLSFESGLAIRTINRHRSSETLKPSLASVVALCIGLKLHPIFSFDLIAKAGHRMSSSREDTARKSILVLTQHLQNIRRLQEAIEHDFGQSFFGAGCGFILFYQIKSGFSKDV